MPNNQPGDSGSHLKAVLQALLVTFLWSTSWVLIKIGLRASLPALTFAGLRYTLAFLCLLPLVLINPTHRNTVRTLSRPVWAQLAGLGVVYYALTQGAQFVSLAFLPAATVTLLLNFSPVLVALWSGLRQSEPPSTGQWGGMILSAAGAVIYFMPAVFPAGQTLGLAAAFVGVLANAGSAIMGRRANRRRDLPPLIITTASMGIGGLILLAAGIATQGLGRLDPEQWLIIGWLAVVNTAMAFTWWNNTLQTLTAVESSIINSAMLPQIALLAWLFLAEPLNFRQIGGLILVGVGALVVQLWRYKAPDK